MATPAAEPKPLMMYDITTDTYRAVTQADVNHLTSTVQWLGLRLIRIREISALSPPPSDESA